MSPRLGTLGNRSLSTAQGNGSISLKKAGSQPSPIHARLAASTPEHTLPYLISLFPPKEI